MKRITDPMKSNLAALVIALLVPSGEFADATEPSAEAAPVLPTLTYEPPFLLCAPSYCPKPLPRLQRPLTGCCPSDDCRRRPIFLPKSLYRTCGDGSCDHIGCDYDGCDSATWLDRWWLLLR